MLKYWRSRPLYAKIFVCLIIGIILGLVFGTKIVVIKPIGDIFLRLLKMLIVPLTFLTLVSGVLSMGDIKSLRSIGGKILLIFVITSIIAAAVGVIMGYGFNPGKDVLGLLKSSQAAEPASFNFVDNIVSWVPANVVDAMATDNMLQVILFALFTGCTLLIMGEEKVGTVIKVVNQGANFMIKMTDLVMAVSPYGILALVANMTATLGSAMLLEVVKFIIADYAGLLVFVVIVYPLMLKSMGSVNPLRFYRNVAPAMLVAASTTSSAATLPVSMKMAEENVGLPEKIYGFALPLGATINMNGMAIAIGLISVFACNLYGYPITFSLIIQFVFLGLVLSMGCAGVKGAGIVMSTVLLQTLGMPLTLVPILAAIWPILDIGHTTVNITGDLVTSTVVGSRLGMLNKELFNSSKSKKDVAV